MDDYEMMITSSLSYSLIVRFVPRNRGLKYMYIYIFIYIYMHMHILYCSDDCAQRFCARALCCSMRFNLIICVQPNGNNAGNNMLMGRRPTTEQSSARAQAQAHASQSSDAPSCAPNNGEHVIY